MSFNCDICNVPCSGPEPYQQHIEGSKHKKKVVLMNAMKSKYKSEEKSDDAINHNASDITNYQNLTSTVGNDQIMGSSGLGNYFCDICDTYCSGYFPYQTHIHGKNHLKKVKVIEDRKRLECAGTSSATSLLCGSFVRSEDETDSFYNNSYDSQPLRNSVDENKVLNLSSSENNYFCEICKVPCSGYFPYQQHMAGKSHKKKADIQEDMRQKKIRQNTSAFSLSQNVAGSESNTTCVIQKPYDGLFENQLSGNELPDLSNSASSYHDSELLENPSNVNELSNLPNSDNEYFCKICKIPCSGYFPYQQHIAGRNHKKQVAVYEAKRRGQTTEGSTLSSNFECSSNRCVTSFDSNIQTNTACRSNDLTKVAKMVLDIEKQGYDSFYCKICEIACTGFFNYEQHVKGDKHRKKREIYVHKLQQSNLSNIPDKRVASAEMEVYNDIDSIKVSSHNITDTEIKQESSLDNLRIMSIIHSNDVSNQEINSTNAENYCILCNVNCTSSSMYEQHILGKEHKKMENLYKLSPNNLSTKYSDMDSFNLCVNTENALSEEKKERLWYTPITYSESKSPNTHQNEKASSFSSVELDISKLKLSDDKDSTVPKTLSDDNISTLPKTLPVNSAAITSINIMESPFGGSPLLCNNASRLKSIQQQLLEHGIEVVSPDDKIHF